MRINRNPQRPFWIYGSSYYIFAAAICIAVFFFVWGALLNDDDTPWIPAGLAASLCLIIAVVLREMIFRRFRRITNASNRRLDINFNGAYKNSHGLHTRSKMSLERNAAYIREIANKSNAARLLDDDPDAHFEIFEMCNSYLRLNEGESKRAGIDVTKLAVIRSGAEKVQNFHKFHLLSWASIESNLLVHAARNRVSTNDKLESAQEALGVLDSAARYYPNEPQIAESIEAVKNFVVSIRVSHWVEQAERAAFKENYKRALNHYRDALFFLARENARTPERDLAAEKINIEIEKLRELLKNES